MVYITNMWVFTIYSQDYITNMWVFTIYSHDLHSKHVGLHHIKQSFWNSSDLGGRKSWGPPITSVMPVPMSAKHFWMMCLLFCRKRRSYCKYRNKFGQLGIRNRIEYVIFYLFLVNIIGNSWKEIYLNILWCVRWSFRVKSP
jgi:hypothetical protein